AAATVVAVVVVATGTKLYQRH
ncbi:MAG: hypothetical protein RLZZ313_540, partial [Verrucomicrobiota bacterium]